MRIARLYLVLLVGMGVPTGLVFGLLAGSTRVGLVGGVAVGVLVSLFAGTLTVIKTHGRPDAPGTRPRETFRVDPAEPAVRVRAADALRALPARVVEQAEGRLVGRTRMNLLTWGERVSVELHAADGGTDVVVRSRPVVGTTLVDYGRGRSHVDRVTAALREPGSS